MSSIDGRVNTLIEERVSTLLGLIVLDNPPCLTLPPAEVLYESASVYSIIGRLVVGDIESAFRIYNHNGSGVQFVIYSHLMFITNNGYEKYIRLNKVNRFFR